MKHKMILDPAINSLVWNNMRLTHYSFLVSFVYLPKHPHWLLRSVSCPKSRIMNHAVDLYILTLGRDPRFREGKCWSLNWIIMLTALTHINICSLCRSVLSQEAMCLTLDKMLALSLY